MDQVKAKADATKQGLGSALQKGSSAVQSATKGVKKAVKKTKSGVKDRMHAVGDVVKDASEKSRGMLGSSASRTRSGGGSVLPEEREEPVVTESSPLLSPEDKKDDGNQDDKKEAFAETGSTESKEDEDKATILSNILNWIHQNNQPVLAAIGAVAVYQLLAGGYQDVWNNSVPIPMFAVWISLGLLIGGVLGRLQAIEEMEMLQRKKEAARALERRETEDNMVESAPGSVRSLQKAAKVFRKPWTTLRRTHTKRTEKKRWRAHDKVNLVSQSMTKALFGVVPKEQRKSLMQVGVTEELLQEAQTQDESMEMLGSAIDDPDKLRAKSLEQDYVETLCPLRGIDIFQTECPDSDLATHPFLIEHGLRERPTFILNLVTQWGNVTMYYEFPDWLQDWDNVPPETENDREDTIALKRFLAGDEEYRSKRLKLLPVLVDGPGPIRFVAPAKKTFTVVRPTLPCTWKQHDAVKDADGNITQHCCLELVGDVMVDRGMRTAAVLVKRYLGSIVGDCALLLEKPDDQKEEEPRACLGLCRFDRIVVESCPDMPPREDEDKTEEERDMRRASMFMGKPLVLDE
ncbi:Protein of unknown function (DUF1336) [Seminavis robusta]|uniref:Protein ENHANCED DISEASE RESISTANCE 2 C-terminal domain-containing protein n=1 Tax=Seminavis robusta TaxID=568900 RepID=A0A9N8DP55_9STRA|nr:Protein of unknown function (DUF1336) [Seminavis robusta]|eukprot:Sro188_g081290.1 Protein of unknown function (DUF1336) (575) ;mRNA; r:77267-79079